MANSDLDLRLASIGIRIAVNKNASFDSTAWIDIEDTLLDACSEIKRDPRLLSFLMSWLRVHGDHVITEKLAKLAAVRTKAGADLRWLSALAAFAVSEGQHKWKKLIVRQKSPLYLHSPDLVKSAIGLKGAEEYLAILNIFIARGSLRIRDSDVFTAEELVRTNRQYRNRYLFGASWRADIVTAIEFGCENPSQIAKRIGCSYEPSHRVFTEYKMATRVSD